MGGHLASVAMERSEILSAYHEIFLRPLTGEVDEAAVARDLTDALGAEFIPVTTDYGATYAAKVGETIVEISPSHDLLDDSGLPFESHPLQIDFRDLAKDEEREKSVMQRAFDGLAHLGKYSLFSSFNTQRLIESRVVSTNGQ
jgi:hypothetical protein